LIIVLALQVLTTDEEKIGNPVAIAAPAPPPEEATASNGANVAASSSQLPLLSHSHNPRLNRHATASGSERWTAWVNLSH